jgi:hypothetical protein
MADAIASTTGKTRAVFSDAARVRFREADEPMLATDPATGVTLSYRFEAHVGGVLRLTGGRIGQGTLAVGCDEHDLNVVATLLLGGLDCQP